MCRSRNIKHSDESLKNKKEYKKKYRDSGRAKIVWERHMYGISKNDISYSECVICGSKDKLHIDHNHSTGKFRGLLCSGCNTGIGLLKEDINIMKRAIMYITHFNNGGSSFKDKPHFELVN